MEHSIPPPGPGFAPHPSTGGADVNGGRVLVLNATFEPINVCTVRRAAVLLLKAKAEIVEHAALGAALRAHAMPRPVVIRLVTYVKVPRDTHRRKITRRAVFARDGWACQYCGARRTYGRPRDPALQGRLVGLDEHRRVLRAVQPPQGRPPADQAGMHPRCSPPRRTRTSSSTSRARRSRPPGASGSRRARSPTRPSASSSAQAAQHARQVAGRERPGEADGQRGEHEQARDLARRDHGVVGRHADAQDAARRGAAGDPPEPAVTGGADVAAAAGGGAETAPGDPPPADGPLPPPGAGAAGVALCPLVAPPRRVLA